LLAIVFPFLAIGATLPANGARAARHKLEMLTRRAGNCLRQYHVLEWRLILLLC